MRLDCSGMEFEKLADLLEQGQFELLNLPVGDERKGKQGKYLPISAWCI